VKATSPSRHSDARKGDADRAKLAMLLCGPILAALGLLLGEVGAHLVGMSNPAWSIVRLSSSCYAVGLALALFAEGNERIRSGHPAYRNLELGIAVGGSAFALTLVTGTVMAGWSWRYAGEAAFVAAPAVMFVVRERTDWQRGATFAVMAAARLGRPLVYSIFPFISMSIICALAALYCFARSVRRHDEVCLHQ
jgi:hypothetical protein